MAEKILTLHPQRKKGVNIDKTKYDAMRETILPALRGRSLAHGALTVAVEAALKGKFEGSISWYMESTKLDLKARKMIERVPGGKYETYRLRK